MMNSLTKKDVP